MRNPIRATPERPYPLPDCILRDGWWLIVRPHKEAAGRDWPRAFQIIEGREEGQIDRYRSRDD
jgi:hypothetical protein